jgi:hypothetical protein
MKYTSRIPVLACMLVTVAFLDMDVGGFYAGTYQVGTYQNPLYYSGERSQASFCHGWPTTFAEHLEDGILVISGETCPDVCLPSRFLDHCNLFMWTAFRFTNVKAAILDILLHVVLIAATGVAVFRLERRRWMPFQFSIADMLSLTAMAGMVLGLVSLDRTPLCWDWYLPLQCFPLFDRVMTLVAIACAVGLIVSTASVRLGGRHAKTDC